MTSSVTSPRARSPLRHLSTPPSAYGSPESTAAHARDVEELRSLQAKNSQLRLGGWSPEQLVFGRDRPIPEDLLSLEAQRNPQVNSLILNNDAYERTARIRSRQSDDAVSSDEPWICGGGATGGKAKGIRFMEPVWPGPHGGEVAPSRHTHTKSSKQQQPPGNSSKHQTSANSSKQPQT